MADRAARWLAASQRPDGGWSGCVGPAGGADGDPRPSIEERYRSRADYVMRIAVAAHALMQERLLLAEDAERYVARAIDGEDFPR
jgi:hypothetical protein